jgi:FdhD protein
MTESHDRLEPGSAGADREAAEGDEGVRSVSLTRFEGDGRLAVDDLVAREEPLEIQIGGASLAVVMRTPGHDAELVRGFLVSERVIADPADLQSLRHSSIARDPEAQDNVMRAVLRDGVAVDLERLRRNLFASSSCGVCGKATVENVLQSAPPLEDASRFTPGFLYGVSERLRAQQSIFEHTGGLHAAALFAPDGQLLVAREDVGRHNAVDKVIGWALLQGRMPLAGHALLVSGRLSFELAQKALAARVPLLAGVSAPSSLAIEVASASRLTLVGFLRGQGFNVYTAPERIAADAGGATDA